MKEKKVNICKRPKEKRPAYKRPRKKSNNDLTTAALKAKAIRVFNKFIRERDKNLPCINCGKFKTLQAGHLYPTSTHSHLRFNEHNVNGECLACNYYNSQSHAYGYRPNLEKKIGSANMKKLELMASKRITVKDDRFLYLDVIEKYG